MKFMKLMIFIGFVQLPAAASGLDAIQTVCL